MVHIVSLSLVIIFVLWLNYEIRKNNKYSRKAMDEFWNREYQANHTRKTDISDMDYITIPFDRLPLDNNPDPSVNSYRDTILSQSDKKILNLSGFSNTELKLKYGVSNIKKLSEYDNNYILLTTTLHKWGERLYLTGYHKEALSVLETALECQTDVHKTYELLGKIYMEQGLLNKFNQLMDKISSTDIRDKEKLLIKLQDILNSR